MTQPFDTVESPLGRSSVQRTLAVIISLATIILMIAFWIAKPSEPLPASARSGIQIDLNEAGLAELSLVPGVGPVLAKRIVTDREKNGDFRTIGELQRVYGIGPRTLENLRTIGFVDRAATDGRIASVAE